MKTSTRTYGDKYAYLWRQVRVLVHIRQQQLQSIVTVAAVVVAGSEGVLLSAHLYIRVLQHCTGIAAAIDVALDYGSVLDVDIRPNGGGEGDGQGDVTTAGSIDLTAIDYVVAGPRTYRSGDVDRTLRLQAYSY